MNSECINCDDLERENADLRARLAAVEAERDKALNQVRHWKEQEEKQRRLRAEEGRWKHRALAAELRASDLPGLRGRLREVEAERDELRSAVASPAANYEYWFKRAQTILLRAEAAEARLAEEAEAHRHTAAARAHAEETIAACGCNSEAGWKADAEFKAMKARLAAVEAELNRRKECAAAERAAGRVCDYCEDFIPEIDAALCGETAPRPAEAHMFKGVPGTTLFCRHDNGDGTCCQKHYADPIHAAGGTARPEWSDE